MSFLTTIDQVSGKSFDYVIVGGGTAGLVLAARLSENPATSVLVLEAGGAHLNDPMIDLPASYGKFFTKPEYDWAFMTVPQPHSENTAFFWPRGKGLGGSSGANFYVWTRPSEEDVDAWERLGNPGWNWKNFLKYSIKSETFIPPSDESVKNDRLTYDPKVHGSTGPITLGFPNLLCGWDVHLQDTLESLGIPRLHEPQGGKRVGMGMDLTTVDPRTNKRVSSVAYLMQAGARPNLKVLVNAPVARILSSSSTGSEFVASGVEFLFDGATHAVQTTSNGEVIISAGTMKTPQILELSGIGDPEVLKKIGVETKVDLPAVGTNVQDHLFAGFAYELKEPEKFNTIDPLADPAQAEEHTKLYEQGKGLLTIGITGLAMSSLSAISERAAAIEGAAPTTGSLPGLAEQYKEQIARLKEGSANAEFVTIPGFYSFPNPPAPGAKHVSLCTTLNRPFSRGTIHATSTDPLAPPTIDPHYFEEEIDLQTYLEQCKFVRKVAQTEPFASLLAREVNPGPSVTSDEELAVWLKKYLTTVHHTSSSCSMLPRAAGGVVDPELKVYGTKGLRVCDLSVVPLIPSAHTQSIVYAVAEQAADIIKGTFMA